MKQQYPEFKLRVLLEGFRQELPAQRVKEVLYNADFAHFIQGTHSTSVNYTKMDEYIEDYVGDTKFELFSIYIIFIRSD